MPSPVPYGRVTNRPSPVPEVHIVWMTSGLGCDGDSVSITAAMQPSIEDVLMGAIPGLPKVHLHNPVLAYEVGDDFMKYWYQAAAGKLDPFVLVVEGSIPNEKIKKEGYWAALGTDSTTGQPITTNTWIDRLAPKALAVVACGTGQRSVAIATLERLLLFSPDNEKAQDMLAKIRSGTQICGGQ